MGNTCFVYIIAHEESGGVVGPVKVGIGANPSVRLNSLQTGNPKPLRLHRSFAVPNREIALQLEQAFHATQKDTRLCGEWFNLTPGKADFLMHLNLRIALDKQTDLSDAEVRQAMDLACGCQLCIAMSEPRPNAEVGAAV